MAFSSHLVQVLHPDGQTRSSDPTRRGKVFRRMRSWEWWTICHHCLLELTIANCSVPVVVLFTKFDALLPVAWGKLAPADRGLPLQERMSKAEALIEGIFNRADVWGRLGRMTHSPSSCVRIRGLYHILPFTHTRCHIIPCARRPQV